MKKILIVVDYQNDFVTGPLGNDRALAIVPDVRTKINEYIKNNNKIIFTRDTHNENYLETQEGRTLPVLHCIYGTDGWEIYGGLDKDATSCGYIDKNTFGWDDWTGFIDDDIDEIEIIGLCTDICVVVNALLFKTFYPETMITVDASCCAGVTGESHKAALLTMRMCQVNIINEDD